MLQLTHLWIKPRSYLALVICLTVLGVEVGAQELGELSKLLKIQQESPTDELPTPTRAPANPANQAREPAAQDPATERIYLGLEADPAIEGIGVQVAVVTRDSPAWKAGFKPGDRILGINGFAIGTMNDMIEQLGKTKPGQSVNFLINRDGRNTQLVAVLMNADLADQIQSNPGSNLPAAAWLGMTAHDLTPSFRDQFGVGAFRGAAVIQVVSGSPAHTVGIRAGDAVIEVGGRPIESAAELQRWVEQSRPGDQSQIVYYRGASRQTAKLVLGRDPSQVAQRPTRPQAFPKNTPANRPTENSAVAGAPTIAPPVPSSLIEPSLSTTADKPLTLDPQTDTQPSQREKALEAEVLQLRKELAEAQQKLAETKQQLDNILRALKD
jgi:membrane-associated protease RseP (regulator of RpoE activity)